MHLCKHAEDGHLPAIQANDAAKQANGMVRQKCRTAQLVVESKHESCVVQQVAKEEGSPVVMRSCSILLGVGPLISLFACKSLTY